MSSEISKKIVLAVDDVTVNLQIIRKLLSKDFDVRVAKSGELALSILSKLKVDLILMDIEMPEMSGFQCIETAQKKNLLGSAAVIFVTSHTSGDIADAAYQICGADCIGKPINESNLAYAIVKALNIPPEDANTLSFWPEGN